MDIWTAIGNKDQASLVAALKSNQSLVESRAKWGNSPLSLAVDMNEFAIVNLLLESGADPNGVVNKISPVSGLKNFGMVPVMFSKSSEVVDLLVKHGADVNVKNDHGESVLFVVSKQYKPDVVERLLHHGSTAIVLELERIIKRAEDEKIFRQKSSSEQNNERIKQLDLMIAFITSILHK